MISVMERMAAAQGATDAGELLEEAAFELALDLLLHSSLK